MKPIQVGILMAAAALGGALLVKWQTSGNATPPVAAAPSVPAAAPVTPVETSPPSQPQALPSPFTDEKPVKASETPRKPKAPRRSEPVRVAQNQAPASPVTTQPSTAPAQPQTPTTPEPASNGPNYHDPVISAPAPPPPPRRVTIAAGTLIGARIVESLSSERNQVGNTFNATLDAPLTVEGLVIAERGARLEGKVVQAQQAGRVKGLANLAIELTQLTTSDGQRVVIETEPFEKIGETSKGEDAAKVGAAAGIGAAIGAIAGGGKGAGIGAIIGGAAGGGGVMATRGKPAVLAPETRINFRLRNAVTVTEQQHTK